MKTYKFELRDLPFRSVTIDVDLYRRSIIQESHVVRGVSVEMAPSWHQYSEPTGNDQRLRLVAALEDSEVESVSVSLELPAELTYLLQSRDELDGEPDTAHLLPAYLGYIDSDGYSYDAFSVERKKFRISPSVDGDIFTIKLRRHEDVMTIRAVAKYVPWARLPVKFYDDAGNPVRCTESGEESFWKIVEELFSIFDPENHTEQEEG